ncbi:hypothetical protein BG015_002860 [Linnemannia schmuckeri]|uniref:F-box domain-containing protein n=1 Tax=Linnemannia schmuckeri TaxID=64567 RepID=A0A9P5S743_9FUNG|nr:hypothetical protein BG015_002860 [Linnemannia schmuckeri]
MAYITDLPPEILELIGNRLDKCALLNVLRTCHLFHRNFSSDLVWKEVTAQAATAVAAGDGDSLIDIGTLHTHTRKVQALKLCGPLPADYFGLSFPNLTTLQLQDIAVNNSPTERDREQESKWARVIRLNPTICDIAIYLRHRASGQSTEIWDAILEFLHRPRQLKVGGSSSMPKFTVQVQKSFWRAVSRFEELDYNGPVDQLRIDPHKWANLTGLQRLSYKSTIPSTYLHIKLFEYCRGLKRLRWSRDAGVFPVKELLQCLMRSDWPHLDDLALDRVYQSDIEFAPVMYRLPPLKHLRLDAALFGPQCFNHLKVRQFATLQTLDLIRCENFTSQMALEVLQGCPHLEVFMGRQIAMSDLISMLRRPWVCSGLKRLGVQFENDLGPLGTATDANKVVLERLSRLTSLEEMDMVLNGARGLVRSNVRACRWRLDAGLQQLATLTRLRIARFDFSVTHMRTEDVQWMVNHWPSLEVLQGYFSLDLEIQQQANALLNERGIRRH